MKKHILSFLLALALCLSAALSAVAAADPLEPVAQAFDYDEAAGSANIKGYGHWALGDTVCAQLTKVAGGPVGIEYWINPEETGVANVFYLESGGQIAPADNAVVDGRQYDFQLRYMPVRLDDETGELVNFQDADYLSWLSVREETDLPVALSDGEYEVTVTASSVSLNGGSNAGVFEEIATFYVVVGVDIVPDDAEDTAPSEAPVEFTDVAADAYYAAPVTWAVEQGITNGTSETAFSPEQTCTRAQIITFLWRAAGSPQTAEAFTFSDVDANAYYAPAAAWAAQKGMTEGATFSPESPCTREMAVEFMWKYAGSPDAAQAVFEDVSSNAVNWAVEQGVTNGTSETTFSPDAICTRGQIVTFLYRGFAG